MFVPTDRTPRLARWTNAFVALIWTALLRRRVAIVTPDTRRLVRHMAGKPFDEVLRDLLGNMELLSGRIGRVENAVDDISRRLVQTIQHVGLVRYNAEEGLGGDLSFALALLNAEKDGVLLTGGLAFQDANPEDSLEVVDASVDDTAVPLALRFRPALPPASKAAKTRRR